MYHIFSIHSSFEGHLGCFQFLAITNSAAMNIVEQMSLLYECASFGSFSVSLGPIYQMLISVTVLLV
ncbi:zinc finger protein [Cricetulus griseus]|nr:zinc finger protein [Cricetulus griseus]